MLRLQYSGYNARFRAEIVKSALKAYKEIQAKDLSGERPMYRPKEWKTKERRKLRRSQKETWYRKGGHQSVIFIPATPQSQLRKKYEREIDKTKLKIKVVETSGISVKRMVQRSDPFERRECFDSEKCMVCRGAGKGQCRRDNVTYEIKCSECECVYVGSTARNGFSRGTEHDRANKKNDPKSATVRHTRQHHSSQQHGSSNNTPPVYNMTVTGKHDSALSRQVAESAKIDCVPDCLLMNSRQEWGHTRTVTTVLSIK